MLLLSFQDKSCQEVVGCGSLARAVAGLVPARGDSADEQPATGTTQLLNAPNKPATWSIGRVVAVLMQLVQHKQKAPAAAAAAVTLVVSCRARLLPWLAQGSASHTTLA